MRNLIMRETMDDYKKGRAMDYDLSRLSLQECMLLDAVLGKLEADMMETEVIITKAEMNVMPGFKGIRESTLEKILRNIMVNTVEFLNPDPVEEIFTVVSPFSTAELYRNEKGKHEVRITCSEYARKFFLRPSKIAEIRSEITNRFINERKQVRR